MQQLYEFSPRLFVVAVIAALAVAVSTSVAIASADTGNSANAKLCQKDGWQKWVRADQTAFTNEGDCVSYAAKG